MTLAEKLLDIVKDIPQDRLTEIIDFAEFIKEKENKKTYFRYNRSSFLENDEALRELAK
jgi:adenylate cyclase class IV